MNNPLSIQNWHILADRFIWSDETALALISQEITDDEIQQYLYTFHGDNMPIDEIKQWRATTRANEH